MSMDSQMQPHRWAYTDLPDEVQLASPKPSGVDVVKRNEKDSGCASKLTVRSGLGSKNDRLPDHIDPCAVPWCCRDPRVESDKRGVERHRERDICGVVRGQVRSEPPHRRQQGLMRMVNDIEIGEVGERLRTTLVGHVPDRDIAAHDLSYLDGKEVGGMQGLLVGRDPGRHLTRVGQTQQPLDSR